MPNNIRGRFLWHELMTSNPKAASAFYKKVVGWKTEGWPADPSYNMFVAPSGPVAGYMLLPEEAKAMGAPPNWLTYIGVPDVDETASHAEELGGEILKQPEDIPDVGRFAVLRDPQEAVFAIFRPSMEGEPKDTPEMREFSWHELATTDPAGALEFYRTLFAWEKTEAMEIGPSSAPIRCSASAASPWEASTARCRTCRRRRTGFRTRWWPTRRRPPAR